jgi:hypothetical protein
MPPPPQNNIQESISKLAERVAGIATTLHLFEERMKSLTSSLGRMSALLMLQAGIPMGSFGALFNAAGFLAGRGARGQTGARLSQLYDDQGNLRQDYRPSTGKQFSSEDLMKAGAFAVPADVQKEMSSFKGLMQEFVKLISGQIGARMAEEKGHRAPSELHKDDAALVAQQLADVRSGKRTPIFVDTEYAPAFNKEGKRIGSHLQPFELGASTGPGQNINYPGALVPGSQLSTSQIDVLSRVTGKSSDEIHNLMSQGVEGIKKFFQEILVGVGQTYDPSKVREYMQSKIFTGFHGIGAEGDLNVLNQAHMLAYGTSPFERGDFLELEHTPGVRAAKQALHEKGLGGSLEDVLREVVPEAHKVIEKHRPGGKHSAGPDAEMTSHLQANALSTTEVEDVLLAAAVMMDPSAPVDQESQTLRPLGKSKNKILSQVQGTNVPSTKKRPGLGDPTLLELFPDSSVLQGAAGAEVLREMMDVVDLSPDDLVDVHDQPPTPTELLQGQKALAKMMKGPGKGGPRGPEGGQLKGDPKQPDLGKKLRAELWGGVKGTPGAIATGVGSTTGSLATAIPHVRAFAVALAQATGALGMLAKAGAPDAFEAVKSMFQIIAAQLGTMLVPALVEVVMGLQKMALWLEEFRGGKGGQVVSKYFETYAREGTGQGGWGMFGIPFAPHTALREAGNELVKDEVREKKMGWNSFVDKVRLGSGDSFTPMGWVRDKVKFEIPPETAEEQKKKKVPLFTAKELEQAIPFVSLKTTPQYSSLEDTYKKMQLDILGKGPVEKILERIHEDSLKEMLKIMKEKREEEDKARGTS